MYIGTLSDKNGNKSDAWIAVGRQQIKMKNSQNEKQLAD